MFKHTLIGFLVVVLGLLSVGNSVQAISDIPGLEKALINFTNKTGQKIGFQECYENEGLDITSTYPVDYTTNPPTYGILPNKTFVHTTYHYLQSVLPLNRKFAIYPIVDKTITIANRFCDNPKIPKYNYNFVKDSSTDIIITGGSELKVVQFFETRGTTLAPQPVTAYNQAAITIYIGANYFPAVSDYICINSVLIKNTYLGITIPTGNTVISYPKSYGCEDTIFVKTFTAEAGKHYKIYGLISRTGGNTFEEPVSTNYNMIGNPRIQVNILPYRNPYGIICVNNQKYQEAKSGDGYIELPQPGYVTIRLPGENNCNDYSDLGKSFYANAGFYYTIDTTNIPYKTDFVENGFEVSDTTKEPGFYVIGKNNDKVCVNNALKNIINIGKTYRLQTGPDTFEEFEIGFVSVSKNIVEAAPINCNNPTTTLPDKYSGNNLLKYAPYVRIFNAIDSLTWYNVSINGSPVFNPAPIVNTPTPTPTTSTQTILATQTTSKNTNSFVSPIAFVDVDDFSVATPTPSITPVVTVTPTPIVSSSVSSSSVASSLISSSQTNTNPSWWSGNWVWVTSVAGVGLLLLGAKVLRNSK
jgi:hypothetical protein